MMLSRRPDALWADFDGQVMVMSIAFGRYFEIRGVGTEVWKLLDTPREPADIVRHILAKYRVDIADCERDVNAFLQRALEAGLLVDEACRAANEGPAC
ncbi:Coenzyme PQQ synthesis protein D (PqqD) [Pigmentiphaga humi]|uniref:Coenzyme PQQ synthesis protein D (PqqD) n=1 Tax=Pigmentiphaga humi TaxID=2478468 RepID=A0A3P4B7H7_9BURK|nr:PqqD family protein [Pigmentiphaga humi]VCU72249.1 Coenzyme PQQ synthesis protein D (PqqD) [Pigmentiphaga humi]